MSEPPSRARAANRGGRFATILAGLALATGIAGIALGVLAYRIAAESRATTRRLEASHLLDTAWGMLGGTPGTTYMFEPARDPERLEEARELIQDHALALDPENPKGHYYLGLYHEARGHPDRALETHRKAVEMAPDRAVYRAGEARALMALKRWDDAERVYLQAIVLEPENAHWHRDLGVISHQQGKLEAAVEHYRRAVEADPYYLAAYTSLGAALRALEREDEARAAFDRAALLRGAQQAD